MFVPGTGIYLNNMLGEFDLVGGTPPRAGPAADEHDGAHDRARPPTAAPRLVVGSAGSARLRGAIMQIVVNVLEHGLGVDEAIDAPRVHVDEPHVHCEGGHDPAELDRLEALGYDVVRWRRRNLFFGGAAAVEVLRRRLARGGRRPPARRRGSPRRDVTRPARAPAEPGDAAGARRARERRRRRAGGLAARRLALAQRRRRAALHPRAAAPPRRGALRRRAADGELVGRLSLMRDPHPASAHVADLGLMVAAAHRRQRHRHAADARGGGVGARRRRDEARAARVPAQRAGDRALREARLRARGAPPRHYRRSDGRFVDVILMAKQL